MGEGVPELRVGERVWVYQAQYGRRFGTAAQYVSVANERAPKLPDETSFEIGACLGIPVMTAHRCVFSDGDVKGKTILVTGGAGRVGYYAIQWAAMSGATVIATASNDQDKATCIDAGAHHVVNHRDGAWPAEVLAFTKGEKIDRVVEVEFATNIEKVLEIIRIGGTVVEVEFATNIEKVLEIIRIGGTVASYSSGSNLIPVIPFYRMMFMDLTVYMAIVYAMPEEAKAQAISDINTALSDGKLKHRIASVVPMDECAKAHELVESGTIRGCVVVTIDSD